MEADSSVENLETPKIIVDEDWKAQVEREKEMLRKQAVDASSSATGQPDSTETSDIPPASMMILVSMLASQAMAAMGLLVDSQAGKPIMDLPLAKHFVDLLAVLEEKTKGNLSTEENQQLLEGLHQLRMLYVSTAQLSATPSESSSVSDSPTSPIIQLP